MSPDGERLTQSIANELSLKKNLIFLCGHYKGVDERVREHLITREISIGDYVLREESWLRLLLQMPSSALCQVFFLTKPQP